MIELKWTKKKKEKKNSFRDSLQIKIVHTKVAQILQEFLFTVTGK